MKIPKQLDFDLLTEKEYHHKRLTEIVKKHIKLDSNKVYHIEMDGRQHFLKFRDIRAEMIVFDSCDKEGNLKGFPFYISCYSLDKLQEV